MVHGGGSMKAVVKAVAVMIVAVAGFAGGAEAQSSIEVEVAATISEIHALAASCATTSDCSFDARFALINEKANANYDVINADANLSSSLVANEAEQCLKALTILQARYGQIGA